MRKFPTKPIDVLIASYGAGHVAMMRPVYESILARGLNAVYLALTTAQAELEACGLDYFGFAELPEALNQDVQAWGKELAGPETSNPKVPYFESVAYHGLNFRELVWTYGEAKARELYKQFGRQSFKPTRIMESLLLTLHPRVVVATNAPRCEQALFEAARSMNVPSLCTVDLFGKHEVKWISTPNYASKIGVLNEKVADFFISNGCPREIVCVTGNPAFDFINSPQKKAEGIDLREKRGVGPDDKVILWASNVEPERHTMTGVKGDPTLPARIEGVLRQIVSQEKGWHLVVRYHPSQSVEFIPGPKVSFSPTSENLHAVIHGSDVVVVTTSTVGLEASLAHRPVVSIDMSVYTEDAPYSRMGISEGVKDLNELHHVIQSVLSKSPSQQKRFEYKATATEAVTNEILALLGEKKVRFPSPQGV